MKDTKLRSVNTHFWDDNYITSLDPSEKLMFLYLLTNPLTNLIGIYEISMRRIGFDTGFDLDTVRRIINRFAKADKIYYFAGYVILANFLKNQKFNTNMQKGAETRISELPPKIKAFIKSKGLEGFERVRNHFEGFETLRQVEVEGEVEVEDEREVSMRTREEDFLDITKFVNPDNMTEEEKKARMNAIALELKNSNSWLTDVSRITHTNESDTWHTIKLFLDELKAKDDYYKSLREIKKHCISWIRKYKPALSS